jgi:hypothetical protein
VPGVGQQRHGIGEKAETGLDEDKGAVQADADGESFAEIFGRVDVTVATAMAMAMVMVGMIMVVVVVMVVGVVVHEVSGVASNLNLA